MNDCDPISGPESQVLFDRWLSPPSPPCALAVSGGGDSTALMVLFADWLRAAADDPGRHVILTVDHGLRLGSAREAEAVAAQAGALGFRHRTLHWDGPKPATGIQAAARAERYRLMRCYMRAEGCTKLLTGHTRDDQAETLLMRLGRGSGLDGLAAMAPLVSFADLGLDDAVGETEGEIVRPLLGVPRSRLRATLQARGLRWVEDPSNQCMDFERPRLRARRAQRDALGLTDPMLALSASRLLRARRAIERSVDQFCAPEVGAVIIHPSAYITFDRARLREAEEEIALRALGRAIAACGGSEDPPSLAKLETLVPAVRSGTADATWTLARALVTVEADVVTLEREPGREPLPEIAVAPGTQAWWDGRFRVAAGQVDEQVTVRSLGQAAARELRQRDAAGPDVPVRVASFVPAFWRDNQLLAVPSLDSWFDPTLRRCLAAQFIGFDVMAGRGWRKAPNGTATWEGAVGP